MWYIAHHPGQHKTNSPIKIKDTDAYGFPFSAWKRSSRPKTRWTPPNILNQIQYKGSISICSYLVKRATILSLVLKMHQDKSD